MGHVMFLTVIKLDFVLNVTTVLDIGIAFAARLFRHAARRSPVRFPFAPTAIPCSLCVHSVETGAYRSGKDAESRKTRVRSVRRSMLDANRTSDCGSASTFLLSPLPNSVGVQPATGKIIPISNAPKDCTGLVKTPLSAC